MDSSPERTEGESRETALTPIACAAREIWATQATRERWKLLGLKHGTKAPHIGSNGVKDASTKLAVANTWPTNSNLAVALNNRFFIVDIDGEDGIRKWELLKRELGSVPKTVAVQTPKGFHLYFQAPSNSTVISCIRFDEGIDVLSTDRYAILPPSSTESGEYRWINHPRDVEIAHFPDRWICWLKAENTDRKKAESILIEKGRAVSMAKKATRKPAGARKYRPNHLPQESSQACRKISKQLRRRVFDTVPTIPGTRNAQLMQLAQVLARHFDIETTPPNELREIVAIWFQAASKVSKTSWSENWREFKAVWSRTTWKATTLLDCWRERDKQQVPGWIKEGLADEPEAQEIIKLMLTLKKSDADWFLGCRQLAGVAGYGKTKANKLLKKLEASGFIKCVERGSNKKRKASTWEVMEHPPKEMLSSEGQSKVSLATKYPRSSGYSAAARSLSVTLGKKQESWRREVSRFDTHRVRYI